MDRRLLLALAVFGGCYRPVGALTTPDAQLAWVQRLGPTTTPDATCPDRALDEAGVVALAVSRNAEIAAFEGEARWLEASADASQARAPQLRMNNLRFDEVLASTPRFEVGLRVPFDKPGTLDAQYDALHQEALAVRARAAEEARRVALDVRVALARYHGWKALVHVAATERGLAQAEVDRLRAGVASKAVGAVELAAAELALIEADGGVARAEGEAARWHAVIAAAIGTCALPEAAVDGWRNEVVPGERDALVKTALSERPSLRRYAALAGIAAARRWEANAQAWPWLDWVQVGYELTDPIVTDTWVFSLAIDIPIANWDGAHVRAAEAEERAVKEAARRDVAAIVAEVDAALAEWRACVDTLAALERTRAGFDEARLATLERAAQQGTADPDDIFAIKRDLGRIERRRVEALIALREARARVLAAIAR